MPLSLVPSMMLSVPEWVPPWWVFQFRIGEWTTWQCSLWCPCSGLGLWSSMRPPCHPLPHPPCKMAVAPPPATSGRPRAARTKGLHLLATTSSTALRQSTSPAPCSAEARARCLSTLRRPPSRQRGYIATTTQAVASEGPFPTGTLHATCAEVPIGEVMHIRAGTTRSTNHHLS